MRSGAPSTGVQCVNVHLFRPMLATKLYAPSPRPSLARRPRLIERMNEGLRRKPILPFSLIAASSQRLRALTVAAPGNAEKRAGRISSVSTWENPEFATRATRSCRLLPPA